MPFNRQQWLREYQRKWIANRKAEWFKNNGPCKHCLTWKSLQLDHVNPEDKVTSHIWSWADERRLKELSKCQVLCKTCHMKKTRVDFGWAEHCLSAYDNRGCRCDQCKKIKAISWKKYSERRKNSEVAK